MVGYRFAVSEGVIIKGIILNIQRVILLWYAAEDFRNYNCRVTDWISCSPCRLTVGFY